ncbi:Uncharacterised protein [Mycobacterium tuberculosis]|nr:Uncharacterised protein [Mycobacterium tuberculosis]
MGAIAAGAAVTAGRRDTGRPIYSGSPGTAGTAGRTGTTGPADTANATGAAVTEKPPSPTTVAAHPTGTAIAPVRPCQTVTAGTVVRPGNTSRPILTGRSTVGPGRTYTTHAASAPMTKPPRVTARAAGATTSPTGTTGAAVAEQARVATRPAGATTSPTHTADAAPTRQPSTRPAGTSGCARPARATGAADPK